MAEAVLSIIGEEILKKLGSFAAQEIGLLWGVKGEVEKLNDTVSTIQAVLRDTDKQPTMSEQRKNYIDKLKEVLHDADDLLDDFYAEALRRQVMSGKKVTREVRIFFSPSNQLVYGLKMAHEIKAIREKLDSIKANKELHIGESIVETQVETSHRETGSYIVAEEVIGRDDDKNKIIDRLMGSNPEENVSIISIVGIGGLGKTALAQLVYNDDKVKNHFELKMWVCVSDVFDVKKILKNIIESGTDKELGNLMMDQLERQLREKLDGKKYLLVLDDVWKEEHEEWRKLERLLMGGARGSRIVVTTRSVEDAKITNTVSPFVLNLEGLSETYSWSLFAKMAFGKEKEPTNQHIVAIGKEIVLRCAGVPLAIRTMGRLLYSRKLEDEWKFFNTELSQLPQKGPILPTLKLSYNHLEPHLKHCFAYCRLFPKDHSISVKKIIYLWIGQGFIKSSNSSQTLEQIGYEYFLLLLWRSFFQDPKEDEWGNIAWCKMHDLMHDLAVEVAGTESTIISSEKEINIPKNTRHVSFDSSREIPVSLLKAKKIRTFLSVTDFWNPSDEEICAIVSKFRRLRILDLHGSGIRRVPHSIGKLKHLRDLDLSDNSDIEMLPSSITRLQNLSVLELSNCSSLKEFPKDIKKLVSLEYLEIDGCDSLTHMPQGLGQLTSLQKLTRFIVSKDYSVSKHCGGLDELKGLNNLRGELRLEHLNHVTNADKEYKAANLKGKEHLQSLVLRWENEGVNVDAMSMEGLQPHTNLRKLQVFRYPGVMFPSWLSSLTNLVNLELSECLRVELLPPLDGFSSLRYLSIKGLIHLLCIDYGPSSLTNLVSLELEKCVRVKHLPALDGLSSLQQLSIRGLDDLELIDCNGSNCSRATFFSSLKELKIVNCGNLKGWRIVSGETATTTELSPFPCLSKLFIQSCPNLTSMPSFPSVEGMLELYDTSGKPLQQTMMMKSKEVSSSSPLLPLSKLKSIRIKALDDFEYLHEQGLRNLTSLESLWIVWCGGLLSLAGEGFSSLTSLRSLEILHCIRLKSISGVFQHCIALEKLDITNCKELDFSDCMQCQGLRSLSSLRIKDHPQLVSLMEGLQHVTSLKTLYINYCQRLKTLSPVFEHLAVLENLQILSCPELDLSDIGIQFQESHSLRFLYLHDIPKLVSLPEWLQHFTTLQVLDINFCQNFTTLPDWTGSFTSLQKLEIHSCPKFTSLPEGIGSLTSLQELVIYSCPKFTSLPEWIRGLSSLQKLTINQCPQLSGRCSNNKSVDWPKIAHIPNIKIDYEKIQLDGYYQLG